MKKHGNINTIVFDKFHDLVMDARLYGSLESYSERMAYYLSEQNTGSISSDDRLRIELGLLWIQMVRGTFYSETHIDWNDLESRIGSNDTLLRIEYDIINAVYNLLLHNEYVAAQSTLEKAISTLKDSAYNFLYGIAARALCNVYIMTGNTEPAEAYALDSISIFRRFDNNLLLASSLNSYAVLKKNCCHYDEAERLLVQAMEIFRSIEAPDGEFLCINNLAVIKMKTGDWQRSELYFERLQVLESKLKITSNNLLIYKVNMAHLHLLRRDFIQAEAELLQLAEESCKSKALKQKALAHEFLGELYLEQGENQKARFHLEKALSIAEEIAPSSDLMTEILRRFAQLYFCEGNLDVSATMAKECIRLCRCIRDRHELGAAMRILGDIHSRNDLPKKARSCYEYSAAILESLHECYELMRTHIALGALHPQASSDKTNSYLLEAKNLAVQMGLPY
ncbi:MAG: tetratricopeptide repeat protein, partial [Candidatus Atribacteria bacterium]